MKLDSRNPIRNYLHWQHGVHFSFVMLLICLCIIIPIVNKATGTPPYWGIILIFSIPSILYVMFIIIVYTKKDQQQQQQDEQDEPPPQIIQIIQEEYPSYFEDDHRSCDNLTHREEQESTRSYNPSTMGIPPSSFLAPTHVNQSIRSSSLDYTPPPPAYHENTYPPSYHSNHSSKDDNTRQQQLQ